MTSSATSSQATSAATKAAQSTSSSTSTSPYSKSNDSGLSTGAKAGVGVIVILAGLAIIAAATWILVRRRRARLVDGQGHAATGPEPSQAPSYYTSSPAPEAAKEMPYYHELPHERQTFELEGTPAPTKM